MPDETERPHLDRGRGRDRSREAPEGARALQPGEKQPAHEEPNEIRQKTVDALNDMSQNLQSTQTYGPSSERAKEPGNPNPTPPHERIAPLGAAVTSPADIAAAHLAAATTAIEVNDRSERQLKSDPRYERDQKVYELGQTGKLGLVPPTEAEVATMAARSGVPEEVIDSIPKTPEEQVADDMQRLKQAEDRAKAGVTGTAPSPSGAPIPIGGQDSRDNTQNSSSATPSSGAARPAAVKPAEQEMGTPPNNLDKARASGLTIGGAEGQAQEKERQANEANKTSSTEEGTVIK